jgi:hypothetical protein
MNGHKFISAQATIDDETFPGQNMTHSLISREYFRCAPNSRSCATTPRVWESSAGKEPRLRSTRRHAVLGDELLIGVAFTSALQGSSVRLRTLLRLAPFSRQPGLTLDPTSTNRFGDPMPKIDRQLRCRPPAAREGATLAHCTDVFESLARASNRPPHRQAVGV